MSRIRRVFGIITLDPDVSFRYQDLNFRSISSFRRLHHVERHTYNPLAYGVLGEWVTFEDCVRIVIGENVNDGSDNQTDESLDDVPSDS